MSALEDGNTVCPNCGDAVPPESRLHTCPWCGAEGYDECCFPAGNGTPCIDCEENAEEDE